MEHLTIRNVPTELAEALAAEKQRRGTSTNQTVLDLLALALGLGPERFDNGLERFAGTWTEQDLAEVEAHLPGRSIDDELWR